MKDGRILERIHKDGFEQVLFCNDQELGLRAIISLHSTILGPATGGCRMWDYSSEEEALEDVLRLSKGMTYKASISGLSMGGGKAVIIGSSSNKTPEKLQRFGEFVESLGGSYVTAKDVGINNDDLKEIKRKTKHILGVEGEEATSGSPSPLTALGVYKGMKACVEKVFSRTDLSGLKVALQGVGSVNHNLAKRLYEDGAELIIADPNKESLEKAKKEFPATIVSPDEIYDADCDIFSPGALGAVLNEKTIPRLKCSIIAGSANNQLDKVSDGRTLFERGIVYAPDYVINAGGLINIYHEREGYNKEAALAQVEDIFNTIKNILSISEKEKTPTNVVADNMALERINDAKKDKIVH